MNSIKIDISYDASTFQANYNIIQHENCIALPNSLRFDLLDCSNQCDLSLT